MPEDMKIWWSVPEIRSTRNKIFCHFGPIFALLPHKQPKSKFWKSEKNTSGGIILHLWPTNDMYGFWDMEQDRLNFLSFWVIFSPFTPLTTWKIIILKNCGYIIVLHLWTENDNHTMPDSWDMQRGRQNFLSFWTIFCPFTPQQHRKLKFW